MNKINILEFRSSPGGSTDCHCFRMFHFEIQVGLGTVSNVQFHDLFYSSKSLALAMNHVKYTDITSLLNKTFAGLGHCHLDFVYL